MKKYLVLFIMLMAAFMLTCAAADAPRVYTSGDYRYVLLEDGTAEITGYTGKAAELTIPAELDGHSVTSIGWRAFVFCDSLTSITIPDSVTSIVYWAFSYCRSLTSITIPDSVTSIGNYAFYGCDSLTSITIPDSVTSIGAEAFSGCRSLTTITVSVDHPTLATIDGVLFEKSTKTLIFYPSAITAESYTIPQGIKIIGDWAFNDCDSLTSITIPDSVTSIGEYAFSSCYSLTTITIPDSVISIGDSAFIRCTSLTSITIPDSVTFIGSGAFSDCDSLTSIIVSVDHPTLATIDGVLFEKSTKTLVCYPCAFTAKIYAIPQDIKIIGDRAFFFCTSLTTITIPDSITSIGEYAFSSCYSLTTITIPDSVTSIGDLAFYNCSNLTTITIPDSVTFIGSGAFSDCDSLTSITVGRDSYARQYCIDNDLPYTYPDANDWLLD